MVIGNDYLRVIYTRRYHTVTDVYTTTLLLTKPSSDDDYDIIVYNVRLKCFICNCVPTNDYGKNVKFKKYNEILKIFMIIISYLQMNEGAVLVV